jgi:hypothetical protein
MFSGVVRHKRRARTGGNVQHVEETIQRNPRKSISRLSQELGNNTGTAYKMFKQDFKTVPYKMHMFQTLNSYDKGRRMEFGINLLIKINEILIF